MGALFDCSYYTEHDLKDEGFKSLGRNIRIAKNCIIVGIENITIGDNVRIDDYCSLIATGAITLGSYIHIGSYCYLAGGEGIVMEDFSGISQGVRIYTCTDDYTGKYLTNPTVPSKYKGITRGAVTLEKHVIIGSGTVILPKVTCGEGVSVGAMSLVTKSLEGWGVYFGCPVRRLKSRSKRLLEFELQLIKDAK